MDSTRVTSKLLAVLADRIAASPQQCIPFAEYMELVLYHLEAGYYATQSDRIGRRGDYLTAPHYSDAFGRALAVQFVQMWEILGKPAPFQLVEMGAGQGLLAQQVLQHLEDNAPDCFAALEYWIVERSPAMRSHQQHLLQPWQSHVRWQTWEDIPESAIVGCCFCNELVDAFPVHPVVWKAGKLWEVCVALADAVETPDKIRFCDRLCEPSTPRLAAYFNAIDIDLGNGSYPENYRTEVNLAAIDWLATVANRLQKGYLLAIDYGYPAHRYHSPQRDRGTLQCYYQQSFHDDPYRYVGEQDITAHVNFTALERYGESFGLTALQFARQGAFLMALGLGERIAAIANATGGNIQTLLRERQALHRLIDFDGMGGFGVLLQGKGLSEEERSQPLQGFQKV